MKRLFLIIKPLVLTFIFIFALFFENAAYQRSLILIGLFTMYLIWQFIRNNLQIRMPYLFLADGLIIIVLEHYSKYVINYFFHFLYIVIIIEIGVFLEKRRDINMLSIIVALASISKFIYMAYMIPNGKTFAELLFNIFAMGFMITLINYSKLQKEGKRKNEKLYTDLLHAHDKLRNYNETIKEKSMLMERNRIAGDLHDSLGHNLTTLIMQLEMVDHINSQGKEISGLLEEVKANARDALTKAREAVSTLQEERGKSIGDIRELINRFIKDTKIRVDFRFPDVEIQLDQGAVLYKVFQECLTNALRHGKCTEIKIIGNVIDGSLNFIFEDNGIGSDFKNGFGQKNMLKRMNTIRGYLEIIPGKPYRIKGRFPLRSEIND